MGLRHYREIKGLAQVVHRLREYVRAKQFVGIHVVCKAPATWEASELKPKHLHSEVIRTSCYCRTVKEN